MKNAGLECFESGSKAHKRKPARLLVATTPYQLFSLACLLMNDEFRGSAENHLIVLRQFESAETLVGKMYEKQLVDGYALVEPYYKSGTIAGMSYIPKYMIDHGKMRKSLTEKLHDSHLPLQDSYCELYIPYPSRLVLDLKDYFARDASIYLYDEGTGTYNASITCHFTMDKYLFRGSEKIGNASKKKKLMNMLVNLMTRGHYSLTLSGVYVFQPDSFLDRDFPGIEVYAIPTPDEAGKKVLTEMFLKGSSDLYVMGHCVFLGNNNAIFSIDDLDEIQDDCLRIAGEYLRDQVIFRPHPLEERLPEVPNENVIMDASRSMWEALCLAGFIDDESILIGFASSAQITPNFLFGLEPTVVFIDKLVKTQNYIWVSAHETVELLTARYKNKDRIYTPSTFEEYATALSDICESLWY